MLLRLWITAKGAFDRRRTSNPRPNEPQEERNSAQDKKATDYKPSYPEADVLKAEWAAFQSLIREIHTAEQQHQEAERNIWAAQLRAAKSLNRVTLVGAIVGFLGFAGVAGTLIITKRAADDGRVAADAAKQSADLARNTTRAWLAPSAVVLLEDIAIDHPFRFRINYHNLGREPSIRTGYHDFLRVFTEDALNSGAMNSLIESDMVCKKPDITTGSDVIWPNTDGYNVILTVSNNDTNKSLFDVLPDVIKGTSVFVVETCLTYQSSSDIQTDVLHHTQFCYFYWKGKSDGLKMNICDAGNHAD